MTPGPEGRGLNAKCKECGHEGKLWIDDETFLALVANAAEKSEGFKATLARADLAGRMAVEIMAMAERIKKLDNWPYDKGDTSSYLSYEGKNLMTEWDQLPKGTR